MPTESNPAIVRLLGAIALLLLLGLGGLAFAGYQGVQAASKAQAIALRETRAVRQDLQAMRTSIHAMQQHLHGLRTDMRQVRQSMASMVTDLAQAEATAKQASDQLAARQRVLDQRLVGRSRQTMAHIRGLSRRRDAVAGPPPWGTFSKLDRMLALQQLLADELLLMSEHLAESQAIGAREIRPLPLQNRPPR